MERDDGMDIGSGLGNGKVIQSHLPAIIEAFGRVRENKIAAIWEITGEQGW